MKKSVKDLTPIVIILLFCLAFFGLRLYKEKQIQTNKPTATNADTLSLRIDSSQVGIISDSIGMITGGEMPGEIIKYNKKKHHYKHGIGLGLIASDTSTSGILSWADTNSDYVPYSPDTTMINIGSVHYSALLVDSKFRKVAEVDSLGNLTVYDSLATIKELIGTCYPTIKLKK